MSDQPGLRAVPPDPSTDIGAYLEAYQQRDLLRLLTCGSVDDGKSTLIGRLLHDSSSLLDDQLAAVKRASDRHGTTGEEIDLALLLDGLQAEREQGITIDVAYRYFSTARRKFIIADTPGHEQYTRNMATGASSCALAIILVDARKGVVDQTRRHAFIATLLGIRHLVLAVNKMDLVGWDQQRFEEVRSEFTDFATKLRIGDVHFIPMSALTGENVVHRSASMPWYQGSSMLSYLETVHIASDRNLIDLRFPIQLVMRPSSDFRGYAGTVASGILRRGAEVVALPSGKRSRVRSLHTFGGEVGEAFPPQAITVTLEDELDLSRGSMLVAPGNTPHVDHELEAMLVWMTEEPLRTGQELILKHASGQAPVRVGDLRYRLNMTNLHREPASELRLNDIGRIHLESPRLLAFDAYHRNRSTGAFILIDRLSNATVAAGTILEREAAEVRLGHHRAPDATLNVRPAAASRISAEERAGRLGQRPFTLWLTGLPRSGKTTLAFALEERLFRHGVATQVLDGEGLRLGLNADLGFASGERRENIRRAAHLARLFNEQGLAVIAALVSPTAEDRQLAREIVGADRFLEIYLSAPLEVCEQRDHDGLFERARSGQIFGVTGIDAPYDPPAEPILELSVERSVEESVTATWELLQRHRLVPVDGAS